MKLNIFKKKPIDVGTPPVPPNQEEYHNWDWDKGIYLHPNMTYWDKIKCFLRKQETVSTGFRKYKVEQTEQEVKQNDRLRQSTEENPKVF